MSPEQGEGAYGRGVTGGQPTDPLRSERDDTAVRAQLTGSSSRTGPDFAPGPHPARAARVRPYTLTGGRTRAGRVLLMETLVSAPSQPEEHSARGVPELWAICELCRGHMRSIAEISAQLRIPLGVVRVLVSDLADQGRIRVYGVHTGVVNPNHALLERVLGGLRRL